MSKKPIKMASICQQTADVVLDTMHMHYDDVGQPVAIHNREVAKRILSEAFRNHSLLLAEFLGVEFEEVL